MSALPRPPAFSARPLQVTDLDELMRIEQVAYPVPWSRGNFIDSLAAGYHAEAWRSAERELVGYWLAMPGVDEMHLLNITVAPAWQGQGLARQMLDRLVDACREARLGQLWLEVRESNEHARGVYRHYGFAEVGRRKSYYPTPCGPREDAVLMSLQVIS